jgi:trehalose 6-phosphate synthase/phosphatase
MYDFEKQELIKKFSKANSKLILIDYDGTLVDYELIPENAVLPDHMDDILNRLIQKPQTDVFIISGRGHKDIDRLLDHLPIDIIAEHGAMKKENGYWKNQINNGDLWRQSIRKILNQITYKCPGSFVEVKEFSLAWHYRNTEPDSGYAHSRELIGLLDKAAQFYNLKILDGNKVVEIMPKENGKGKAVKKLTDLTNYDFILSIGDDTTDEEMFEILLHNPQAHTIKVGNGETFAKNKVADINEVMLLLKQLSL